MQWDGQQALQSHAGGFREQRTYLAHGCCPFLAVASFPAPVFIPGEREDFLLAAREKKYNIEVPIYKEWHV